MESNYHKSILVSQCLCSIWVLGQPYMSINYWIKIFLLAYWAFIKMHTENKYITFQNNYSISRYNLHIYVYGGNFLDIWLNVSLSGTATCYVFLLPANIEQDGRTRTLFQLKWNDDLANSSKQKLYC